MVNWKGWVAIICVGAGIGMFTYTAAALEAGWLYTRSDFNYLLQQNRINDLANVCDALGEAEWAEARNDFGKLRGWGNAALRREYAEEIMGLMALENSVAERVRSDCATRLSAA